LVFRKAKVHIFGKIPLLRVLFASIVSIVNKCKLILYYADGLKFVIFGLKLTSKTISEHIHEILNVIYSEPYIIDFRVGIFITKVLKFYTLKAY